MGFQGGLIVPLPCGTSIVLGRRWIGSNSTLARREIRCVTPPSSMHCHGSLNWGSQPRDVGMERCGYCRCERTKERNQRVAKEKVRRREGIVVTVVGNAGLS